MIEKIETATAAIVEAGSICSPRHTKWAMPHLRHYRIRDILVKMILSFQLRERGFIAVSRKGVNQFTRGGRTMDCQYH